MFVTNWISTTKIQKISEITNFFRHYFLSRTEVYDYTDRLGEIQVPCLVMSGTNDLCTPLVAKTLYDGIQDSKWHLFVGARHMPFAEQNDEYCQVLEEWMEEKD